MNLNMFLCGSCDHLVIVCNQPRCGIGVYDLGVGRMPDSCKRFRHRPRSGVAVSVISSEPVPECTPLGSLAVEVEEVRAKLERLAENLVGPASRLDLVSVSRTVTGCLLGAVGVLLRVVEELAELSGRSTGEVSGESSDQSRSDPRLGGSPCLWCRYMRSVCTISQKAGSDGKCLSFEGLSFKGRS